MIDGKLRWGLIDETGNEVIPCKYYCLYSRYDTAVQFMEDNDKQWRLMDFNGNVICDKDFNFIHEYDSKHRLISCGDDEDYLGVYSIDKDEFIISKEYDCIDFSPNFIECELTDDSGINYVFDYDGNQIYYFDNYDWFSDRCSEIEVHKDGMIAITDLSGNIIKPFEKEQNKTEKILQEHGYKVIEKDGYKGLILTENNKEYIEHIFTNIDANYWFLTCSIRNSHNWIEHECLYIMEDYPQVKHLVIDMSHRNDDKQEITARSPGGIKHYKYYYVIM